MPTPTANHTATYSDLSDLANKTPAEDLCDLPDTSAYRFGITEVERVQNSDPQHYRWLYHSPRRPLGMWVDLPVDHSLIGATQTGGTLGTSAPLPLSVIDGLDLVPFDAPTRAASVLKTLLEEDGEVPPIATARGENGTAQEVRVLLSVPEHDAHRSLVRFKQGVGPIGHSCYCNEEPFSFRTDSLLTAVQGLLRGDARWIGASLADSLVSGWIEEGAEVPL